MKGICRSLFSFLRPRTGIITIPPLLIAALAVAVIPIVATFVANQQERVGEQRTQAAVGASGVTNPSLYAAQNQPPTGGLSANHVCPGPQHTYTATCNDPEGRLDKMGIYARPVPAGAGGSWTEIGARTGLSGGSASLTATTNWTSGYWEVTVNCYDKDSGKCSGNPDRDPAWGDDCKGTDLIRWNVDPNFCAVTPTPPLACDSVCSITMVGKSCGGGLICNEIGINTDNFRCRNPQCISSSTCKCPPIISNTPTPQFHRICKNNICQNEPGPGPNDCSPLGDKCGVSSPTPTPETHRACVQNLCQVVKGPGPNDCTLAQLGKTCGVVKSPTPTPFHKVCEKNVCKLVAGSGSNASCTVGKSCGISITPTKKPSPSPTKKPTPTAPVCVWCKIAVTPVSSCTGNSVVFKVKVSSLPPRSTGVRVTYKINNSSTVTTKNLSAQVGTYTITVSNASSISDVKAQVLPYNSCVATVSKLVSVCNATPQNANVCI